MNFKFNKISSVKNEIKEIKQPKQKKFKEKEKNETLVNKIKSIFILQRILSYLNLRKKLDIIKYNNNLQNFLENKIDDYKETC